jgi:hypothetical protein
MQIVFHVRSMYSNKLHPKRGREKKETEVAACPHIPLSRFLRSYNILRQ